MPKREGNIDEMGGRYLELKNVGVVELGVLEHVEVERTTHVLAVLVVPTEHAQSHLKSIHPCAIVLQLLVSVLNHIIIVSLVIVTHVQA